MAERLWPRMTTLPRLASVSLALVLAAGFACDGDDDESEQDDSMAMDPASICEDGEVIVSYVGTDDDRDECSDTPEPCDVEDPCFEDACVEALYALCEEGTLGSACAELGGPVTVSCN